MAKTNFTKVEEALDKGLQQAAKDQLLRQADAAQGKTTPQLSDKIASFARLQKSVEQDLKWLKKHDKNIYTRFSLSKGKIKILLKIEPTAAKDEDLTTLHSLQAECKEKKKNLESTPNDTLIEEQRQKHIDKRFNVKDKWLPLK